MLEKSVFLNNIEMLSFLKNFWGVQNVTNIASISRGCANLHKISTASCVYVLKEYPSKIIYNDIIREALIIQKLQQCKFPVVTFIPSKQGNVLRYKDKLFELTMFIEGNNLQNNSLNKYQLTEMSKLLAGINKCLSSFNNFPVWNGTEDYSLRICRLKEILSAQLELGSNKKMIQELKYKLNLCENLKDIKLDMQKFTWKNSHGDYSSQQLIFKGNKIVGLLDFAEASNLPIVWEIFRSYVQSSSKCRRGEVDFEELKKYISCYLTFQELNRYEVRNIANLYLYHLAPLVFGYRPNLKYCKRFRKFTDWRFVLMKWLEKNSDDLGKSLEKSLFQ